MSGWIIKIIEALEDGKPDHNEVLNTINGTTDDAIGPPPHAWYATLYGSKYFVALLEGSRSTFKYEHANIPYDVNQIGEYSLKYLLSWNLAVPSSYDNNSGGINLFQIVNHPDDFTPVHDGNWIYSKVTTAPNDFAPIEDNALNATDVRPGVNFGSIRCITTPNKIDKINSIYRVFFTGSDPLESGKKWNVAAINDSSPDASFESFFDSLSDNGITDRVPLGFAYEGNQFVYAVVDDDS